MSQIVWKVLKLAFSKMPKLVAILVTKDVIVMGVLFLAIPIQC